MRYALLAAGLILAAFALWHPAPAPPKADAAAPAPPPPARERSRRRARPAAVVAAEAELVVYVVGAVARPGLYRLAPGARAADAVERAGGLSAAADPEGVNLAARVADGEEIDVPRPGQRPPPRSSGRARRPRAPASPPPADVDVNLAGSDELARVPGIGRALAQRIVELRDRDGAYASLDELLDVAGMSAARLERARPFLRQP